MTSAELLAGLVRTLDQLTELTELGRERYDTDVLVRLAVQRLWITAGNYADAYRAAGGVATGTQPWSELYGYRNVLAHLLPRRSATTESGSRQSREHCGSATTCPIILELS